MKLNHKFVRTVTTTAAVLGAAAMLSVGAFAAEADINDPAAAGYLPPQEQMVQGDIALHSADVAIGEKDPTYGGYGAPEGNPIQGNIMLISGDELAQYLYQKETITGEEFMEILNREPAQAQ